MKRVLVFFLCMSIAYTLLPAPATATAPIRKQFQEMYAPEGGTPAQQKIADALKKDNCFVCHNKNPDKPADRTVRNTYGLAIDEFLTADEAKKDKDKIKAALEKAEGMKIKKDDPNSPTFGEKLKNGELPIVPNSEPFKAVEKE